MHHMLPCEGCAAEQERKLKGNGIKCAVNMTDGVGGGWQGAEGLWRWSRCTPWVPLPTFIRPARRRTSYYMLLGNTSDSRRQWDRWFRVELWNNYKPILPKVIDASNGNGY